MKNVTTETESRLRYSEGQLLQLEDLQAEQNYHIEARRRHNRHLHDWGVVYGLTVSSESSASVTVHPGLALDERGNEIALLETRRSEVPSFQPSAELKVALSYEESDSQEGEGHLRIQSRPAVIIAENPPAGAVELALVRLDGQGKVASLDDSRRRQARVSTRPITAADLDDSLRGGWLRLPFRPYPLERGPEIREEAIRPAFVVGATQAHSPLPEKGAPDRGAGGTMALPIPPCFTRVTRLRVCGEYNEGEIHLNLIIGGWNHQEMKKFRKVIHQAVIPSGARTGAENESPFEYDSGDLSTDARLDPEYHTLSIELWGTAKTSIRLIAVQCSY